MNKIEQTEAVYFSEERIKKLKQEDNIFKEEIKKTERRVLGQFLSGKVELDKIFNKKEKVQ